MVASAPTLPLYMPHQPASAAVAAAAIAAALRDENLEVT